MKMNQKEAVFQAVTNVCGVTDGAYTLSKEERAQVNAILFEGFTAGAIEIKGERTESELKSYVNGLTSNWIRKDKRLNGNIAYITKNPGSRAGSSDPSLKAMKVLLASVTTDEGKAEVQAHIDARLAEISANKKSTKTVDFSALPADLQKFATATK
jgi:uncharacterized protein YdaU (DUF1376 family)